MKITLDLNPEETLAFRRAAARFPQSDCPTTQRSLAQWLLLRACNAVATTANWEFGHSLVFDARVESPEERAATNLFYLLSRASSAQANEGEAENA